jgi:hypothetical protein
LLALSTLFHLALSLATYNCLITLLQHNKDFLSTDNKSDNTTDNETKSLFNNSNNNISNTNDIEILSNEIDSNTDDKVYLSDDREL